MKNIKIISTLGPATLNKKILNSIKRDIDIFRLNMSHLSLEELIKNLRFLRQNKIKNICLDTEGAQVRTLKTKKRYFKINTKIKLSCIHKTKNNFIQLYPKFSLKKIKVKSKILIGFNGLRLEVTKVKDDKLDCRVVEPGYLESNKGVHIYSEITLDPLTQKDRKAIEIAKKFDVKIFALSFANNKTDISEIKKIIPKKNIIISKIETRKGFLNRVKIIKMSDAILIDRGDLSRYIDIPKIPLAQRLIINDAKKLNKNIYVATNLLETMIESNEPTRAESNDIFSSLEMGSDGLVLAAETAIGKHPRECINFLKESIKIFNNQIKFKLNNDYFF